MAKVILISQFALPYNGIGSWTTLYANYITRHKHLIDYIICPQPAATFDTVQYGFIKHGLESKIRARFDRKNYAEYLQPLKNIIEPGEKYIIQIVDNQGILLHLDAFVSKHYRRSDFHIQYFHHGFSPFASKNKAAGLFSAIDELILLTLDSYKYFKQYYTVFPCKVAILHNGIDTSKFVVADTDTKTLIKQNFGLEGKTVFIWCSQDRPKKGLDLILDAWKKVYDPNRNIALLVIGTSREIKVDGVSVIGRIPNDQLPQYYHASDVYLFPTLCKEGFGLTLIEALHCGNYCIASASGGVPEVLQYGKLGKLIENPNFVGEWFQAISDYLHEKPDHPQISKSLYSMQSWNQGMDRIINDALVSLGA